MDWPHRHIVRQLKASASPMFEALSDEGETAEDFDPFGLKRHIDHALPMEPNVSKSVVSNAMKSLREGFDPTFVASGEEEEKPSTTITKGKLSGMTLASALARRRDICDGMHASQADSCSYIRNYQSALARSQAKTHESRYRDQWNRTVTLSGHVRRQREAFDLRASSSMDTDRLRASTNPKSSGGFSPDRKDASRVPPTVPSSSQKHPFVSPPALPSFPGSHSPRSTWSETDFGESESLFSPECLSIISEHHMDAEHDIVLSTPHSEWPQALSQAASGRTGVSSAPHAATQMIIETINEHGREEVMPGKRTGEIEKNSQPYSKDAANSSASNERPHQHAMGVPRQITLAAQEDYESCAPLLSKQSSASLGCGTNEDEKSTPESTDTHLESEHNATQNEGGEVLSSEPEERDVAFLVRRRIETVRRKIASKELHLHADVERDSKPSSPEFLLMRAKLRKVNDRDAIEAHQMKVPSATKAHRCEEEVTKYGGSESVYPTQQSTAVRVSSEAMKVQEKPDVQNSPLSERNRLSDRKDGSTSRDKFIAALKSTTPSFDGLPNEGTEVTAPDSFELGSTQSIDPSETSNRMLEDAQTPTHPVPATDSPLNPEIKAKISTLFQDRSASILPQRTKPGLKSAARKHEVHVPTSTQESTTLQNDQGLCENMHPRVESEASSPKSPSGSADSTRSGEFPAAYAKYYKMMKYGMPREAVEHAMIRDGVDPSILDGDGRDDKTAIKDDKRYAKYFRMLKVGLPMVAVKHAMERDGLDPTVMDGDHNNPAGGSVECKEITQKLSVQKPKDTHRRTRLHWQGLDKVRSNSVWALADEDPDVAHVRIDENEFAQLFQAELSSGDTKPRSKPIGAETENECSAVKVICSKRANNGGIILARLKFHPAAIAKEVDAMNEISLTPEQLQSIIPYLPTSEEKELLRSYLGESYKQFAQKFGGLCECEKFMVAMMDVCRSEEKMQALLFIAQYTSLVKDLRNDALVVEQACDELNRSTRLRKLLGIVLAIGNRLNTAGHRKDKAAAGVTLDSLLKLNQVKAFDKQTTFLQYVVSVVARNNEPLLCFKDELSSVHKADKIYWDQCIEQLRSLEKQLRNTQEIALHQARVAQGDSDINGAKMLSDDPPTSSKDAMEEEASLRASRVGSFVLSAISEVSELRNKIESIEQKFQSLKEYFGETDTEMQPHDLFHIIATFSHDIDMAKKVLDAKKSKVKRRLPWRRRNSTT